MLRKLLITLGVFLLSNMVLFAQGTLKGEVADSATGETLPFVPVVATQGGVQKGVGTTDIDGVFTIKPLAPGRYDIEIKYIGYKPIRITGVEVAASGFTVRNITLASTAQEIKEFEIVEDKIPLIVKGSPESGKRLGADDIARMPTNSVEGVVSTIGGVGFSDGGASSARGEGDMVTMQGNVRKRGSVNIPTTAIAEIQVILGGTPAKFGEAIGGVQIITLKPPATQFGGLVKYETTEFLDNRGYNRLELFLTGPLWKKTNSQNVENTIIGYRLMAYGSYMRDRLYRPDDRSIFQLKENKRDEIIQSPFIFDPLNPAVVKYKADYLLKDDFEQVSVKSNSWGLQAYMDASFDIRFSDNAVLAVGVEYQYSNTMQPSLANTVMNNENNPERRAMLYQITADFTHRFPNAQDSKAKIKNLMYNLSGSYYNSFGTTQSSTLGDKIFEYGYIGQFEIEREKKYILSRYEIDGVESYVWQQNGKPAEIRVNYTPGSINPILANYTSQVFANVDRNRLNSIENIKNSGGLINGMNPKSVYMFASPGSVSSTYSKSQEEQIYFQAKASGDIGNHAIEIGFQYEQMINRSYSLGAAGLWTLMGQLVNKHMMQLSKTPTIIQDGGMYPIVSFDQEYTQQTSAFDVNLRKKLQMAIDGNGENDWINIYKYDPSYFSLDMFSPDDLFNSGKSYVRYIGYDHTGEVVKGKKSLNDFFNNPSRTLGAWNPIYMAGYIQDQFYFRDLIFNIGLRVDRFDGNQMGLKDPYLLYESKTVGEVSGSHNIENGMEHPAGAKNDWVVYVDDFAKENLDEVVIKGYRSGSTWYDATGKEISNPFDIQGSSTNPTPFRKDTTNNPIPSIGAFKEYDPQYVFMPRIAFSFPVSDESQFKASYDIIARRPTNWQADYFTYLYMYDPSVSEIINNPNLLPEKITNYEIGFEQVLNKVSMISIAAYYKETRDLIQLVQFAGADPNPYYFSYDNFDFKTIKGVTISYDLRRMKNIRLNANYTLQYAEGTSLSKPTMTSLITEGYANLKMLNPITDDRRHEFKVNFDFHYESGNKYNGPVSTRIVKDENGNERSKTIKWLENAGFNVVAIAQSGRPYTRALSNVQSTIVGSYNSARLPWQFHVNMELKKGWMLKVGKRPTVLTAFARINNIFNIRNVMSVYAVTGDPDDNGFLTDPETQTAINSYANPQSYRDMYALSLLNSSYANYSSPRQMVLGVSYMF